MLTFPSEPPFLFLSKPFQLASLVIDYCVFNARRIYFGRSSCAMLLDLPEQERTERGLEHTPREIWQQPDTWETTYQSCSARQNELRDALRRAGIGRGSTSSPTVYLFGAGTSDYAGRALAPLLRQRWGCDIWPFPSTTLLTEFDEYHRAGREYLWISFSRSESVSRRRRSSRTGAPAAPAGPSPRHYLQCAGPDGSTLCAASGTCPGAGARRRGQ